MKMKCDFTSCRCFHLDAEVLSLGYLADGKVNSFVYPLSLDSDDFTNARFEAIAVVSVNIERLPRYNLP